MSYVVLARKWRPQTFADLTGQEHVTQTLINAIKQDRVPHALLFTGARGVGKTTSARLLAMALNCESGPTTEPCGTCIACREIQSSSSVDVLEFDGASNRGINEIRELRESVRYAPHRGRYKVYIIDEVHMLTTEAFNALLKTLEEPPPHVIFIFATTEAQKIPVTILSRCQRFDFRRIPSPQIVSRLREITAAEGLTFDDPTLSLIARQSEGCMRDALSLTDQVIAFAGSEITAELVASVLGVADRGTLFDLTDAFAEHDVDRALQTLARVIEVGTDLPHFSTEFVSHLRDLTVISVTRDPGSLTDLSDEEVAQARAQVRKLGRGVIMRMFDAMVQAAEEIAHSNYPRLVFEMALIRMARMEKVASIDHLIAQLEAIAMGKKVPASLIQELTPLAAAPVVAQRGPVTAPALAPALSVSVTKARAEDASSGASNTSPTVEERGSDDERGRGAEAAQEVKPPASVGGDQGGSVPPHSVQPAASLGVASREASLGASAVDEVREPSPAESGPVESASAEAGPAVQAAQAAPNQHEPSQAAGSHPAEPRVERGAPVSEAPKHTLAASAPSPAPDEEEVPHASQQGAASNAAEPSAAVLTPELWRRAVTEGMVARDMAVGRLLAQALLLSHPGAATIALAAPLLSRLNTEARDLVLREVTEVLGGPITLDFISKAKLSESERSGAYTIAQAEADESAIRTAATRKSVKDHPAVQAILKTWPGSRLQINVLHD